MNRQPMPDRFQLDMIGGNGTPFRFVFWPKDHVVRYYDRRYTLKPEDPGYGINHTTEDGQCCGGALDTNSFTKRPTYGIAGWHDVQAWDIDHRTVALVGDWINLIMEEKTWA